MLVLGSRCSCGGYSSSSRSSGQSGVVVLGLVI